MKYRYYRCLQYNNKWDYYSHRYLISAYGEILNKHLNKYEISTECTVKEFYNQPKLLNNIIPKRNLYIYNRNKANRISEARYKKHHSWTKYPTETSYKIIYRHRLKYNVSQSLRNTRRLIHSRLQYNHIVRCYKKNKVIHFAYEQLVKRGIIEHSEAPNRIYDSDYDEYLPINLETKLLA